MRILFFWTWPVFVVVSIFFTHMSVHRPNDAIFIEQDMTMCGSQSGTVGLGEDGKFIPALPGWGTLRYTISTKNDSTQFYFNQGLSFYYGYHMTEALASFKEASRFDPSSAMTYWGQALAMGPFYNTYVYRMRKEVPEAVAMMNTYSSGATKKEQALIYALQKRYSNDLTNADRKQLDVAYASALAELEKKYPDDTNITALYIDAVMLQHKWDFWNQDGTPKPWTTELVNQCEAALKNSQHPAILHYYIHLTEASREPSRALFAADLLKDGLPGIGHMVHMSSHMYQRNGLYAKGVSVNNDANDANNNLDTHAPGLKLGKDKTIHFYAVQSYCAMTAGMYEQGVPLYDRARNRQLALNPSFEREPYAQFVYMMPVMARVRLGKWDDVLNAASPQTTWKYASVLDNFAKGIANIRRHDVEAARKNLTHLDAAMNDSILSVRLMPYNSPLQSCRIASAILNGEILFEEGKHEAALAAFHLAVEAEDKLVYREPQDWLIPARQFLGARLLKLNRNAEAENVYRDDLIMNPGNGWSLIGLSQSLQEQKRLREASSLKPQYTKAFESSDVQPAASVF